MNFFFFHIGDYAGATQHLSWDEDMAYRRLMDIYYAKEKPIPADMQIVYRLVRANTPAHRKAVDAVLAEFFIVSPEGFMNSRCEEELRAHIIKRSKAKQSADARWSKPIASQTHSERNANAPPNAMRSQCDGNAPTTHYPLPSKDGVVGSAGARPDLAMLETQLRDAAGWQGEPAPNLSITGEVAALIEAGANLDTDVLPVVKALAPQAKTRTSWKYFIAAIARARDDRIAALTDVSPQSAQRQSHDRPTRQNARKSTIDTIFDDLSRGHGEGGSDVFRDEPGDGIHAADRP